MKTYLDCIPCFFKQALEAARLAGCDEVTQKRILNEVSKLIINFRLESSPPEMGRAIYWLVKKVSNKEDPYKEIKEKSNRLALELYPELKRKVEDSKDRLLTAIELAIASNVVDYGVKNVLNVEEEIGKILNKDFESRSKKNRAIFDYQSFKDGLDKARTILYLADNAGEIVFDRILIEEIDKEVICALRDRPIINDATLEDAKFCGLDRIAELISSGCDAPGILLDTCSKEFLRIYEAADLIISKGQGNFEALSNESRPIFFLFKAKCPVVARDIGCEVGDIVLKGKSEK
jgi:uncharacterized protein with ATP-grasp and redox domains